MMGEDATNSLRGDALHDSIVNELSRQFHAVPLREGPSRDGGPLAGHLDQMDRNFRRGKKALCLDPVYHQDQRAAFAGIS